MNIMAPTIRTLIEPTGEQAVKLAAELIKTIICEAAGSDRPVSVALAGGTTPHRLYQVLAASGTGGEVPWPQVDVFFGDERAVGLDHVESNYNMAQRTMLDNLPIEPSRIHPMRGDADDLDASAAEYEQTIRRAVPAGADGIPQLDFILLGVGGDGHTASLFPNTEAINEKKKLVAAVFVPVLDRKRLTFTFPLINAARNVMLLVMGDDKADVMAALLGPECAAKSRLPASKVRPKDGMLTIVMDAAAARRSRG